jgi:hypothetical protein
MARDVYTPRKAPQKRTSSSANDTVDTPPHTSGTGSPLAGGLSTPAKIVKSEFHNEIYCNNVRIGITQWDFALQVGQTVDGEDGAAIVRQDVTVKFSPQFFKSLVGSMTATLKYWETTFGEIPMGLGQVANTDNLSEAFETLKGVLEASDKKTGSD